MNKKYLIKINDELEGWDVIEKSGIESEEGNEDSVVATFYEYDKAVNYVKRLNHSYLS